MILLFCGCRAAAGQPCSPELADLPGGWPKVCFMCLLLFLRTISEPLSLQPPRFSLLSLFKSVQRFCNKKASDPLSELLSWLLCFVHAADRLCLLWESCNCKHPATCPQTCAQSPVWHSLLSSVLGLQEHFYMFRLFLSGKCLPCSSPSAVFSHLFCTDSSVAQCTAMDLLFYLPELVFILLWIGI